MTRLRSKHLTQIESKKRHTLLHIYTKSSQMLSSNFACTPKPAADTRPIMLLNRQPWVTERACEIVSRKDAVNLPESVWMYAILNFRAP